MNSVERGCKYMNDARTFIDENPQAWDSMVEEARRYIKHHKHFSIGLLAEKARWSKKLKTDADGFGINHNTEAALARILRDEIPICSNYMTFRHSAVDDYIEHGGAA